MKKSAKEQFEELTKIAKDERAVEKKKEVLNREWYSLRSILGYSWAMFYFLLGGREAGKSYAVTEFCVKQFIKYGRPFKWMRLTEASSRKLLSNNAEKLIDPDLRRKYNIDLQTNGDAVYVVERSKPDKNGKTKVLKQKLMCRVLNLSTYYNDKGSGLFDKDFLNDPKMYYNIVLDEMNREKNEKNSFDIVYSFCNQLENNIRSTKLRTRIICIGNTLEEASDLLCSFNFIPENFGRFKLVKNKGKLQQYIKEYNDTLLAGGDVSKVNEKYKNVDFGKRAVIEYIEPSEKYLTRRKGTVADILMPTASTFTNKIDTDSSLVNKKRLNHPNEIIKFSKDQGDWFTVWDDGIISEYRHENKTVIAMKPYLDEVFETKVRDMVISCFDHRGYCFRNLITFKKFQKQINLLKPRGN